MPGSELRADPTQPIRAESTAAPPAERKRNWLLRRISAHAYIGESVGLIGVMSVLNLAYMPAQPGFLGIEPNPFWVPVLLMAARYGFRASLLASILAAASYFALVSLRVREEVISLRDLFSWSYAKPAVLLLLGGVVVGMLVERHRARVRKLEGENERLIKENLGLQRGEQELRDVNVELANRVVGATDTLPMLYKYAKKLNVLDVGQILTVLTELLCEVIKAKRGTVYRREGKQLVLHAANGRPASGPPLALQPEILELLLSRRQVVTLHDLLTRNIRRSDLFLCGPLSTGTAGEVIAVLAVEEIEFLRYNPATIRLFNVITDWACASLEKAGEVADQPAQRRMEEARTTIMRAQRAASIPPGVVQAPVVSAGMGSTVAGGVEEGSPFEKTTISGPPVDMMRPSAGAAVGPIGQLLDEASARLFGSARGPEDLTGLQASDVGASPRSTQELQHLLTGELQIASTHGSPLAKLLAEIDGYVSDRTGQGQKP